MNRPRVILALVWFWTPCFVGAQTGKETPLKVHLIGAGEYKPVESLGAFKTELEKFHVGVSTSFGKDSKTLPDLDRLRSADVMLIFVRRLDLPTEQMAIIRDHWEKGKGIVALRTASHAFQPADNESFSKVLGGSYLGPGSYTAPFKAIAAENRSNHPVLRGVGPIPAKGAYRFELAKQAVVLQIVESDKKIKAPATWTNEHNGGRVVYSTMGVPEDFQNEDFRRLLINSIFWVGKRMPEK